MIELVKLALGTLKEALIKMNLESARKYVDQFTDIELEILKEEEKGYESDDAKIEALYKKLAVIYRAAEAERHINQSRS